MLFRSSHTAINSPRKPQTLTPARPEIHVHLQEAHLPIFFPLPLCLGLLLAGLVLLWFTKKQKAGKILASIAGILLLLLSHSVVGDLLLGRLESAYPRWTIRPRRVPAPRVSPAGGLSCSAEGIRPKNVSRGSPGLRAGL